MTIEEIKNLPNKATIKSFQGRIATGSPPKDPTPQQQRFGEHIQTLSVEDSTGALIEVRLLRTSQHMKSDCVGKTVVFEAAEDNNGKPKGLRVEKWQGKTEEMCYLSVDAKNGALTYLMANGETGQETPAVEPTAPPEPARYDPTPGSHPAHAMVKKLQWCWDQIDWVDDDDIRQKLATTLWIELNMKRIDTPPLVAPKPVYHEMKIPAKVQEPAVEEPRPCEKCGEDLGHGPGPLCGTCSIEKVAEEKKEPTEGDKHVPGEIAAAVRDELEEKPAVPDCEGLDENVPEGFPELRDKLCEKYTTTAYCEGFNIIYEANGDDLQKTCEQIMTETKDFKQLLFDIAETNQSIPF